MFCFYTKIEFTLVFFDLSAVKNGIVNHLSQLNNERLKAVKMEFEGGPAIDITHA